jgi:hypothetical protein
MAAGKFFSGTNLYLASAGLLSGAMLFAPIAYASNFAAGIHASIYGAWVQLETSMGHGVSLPTTIPLFDLPWHLPYAALGLVGLICCLVLCFINKAGERKQLWIGRCIMAAFGQMFWGVLLRMMAGNHVGYSALPDSIDIGFQREMVLHLFIIYFLWRAWRKQAAHLKLAESATT